MRVGDHYARIRRRLVDLLDETQPDEWNRAVPACPGWRVRDVVAHLRGTVDDAMAGRLQGPPTEAQTAAQVARQVADDTQELLRSWSEAAPPFEAAISSLEIWPAALDVLAHEYDLRHALGRPGGRDDPLLPIAADLLLARLESSARLTAVIDGVRRPPAGSGPPIGLRTTAFEVFRAALGRRTASQVRDLEWTGDPDVVIGSFFVFGPARAPLVE